MGVFELRKIWFNLNFHYVCTGFLNREYQLFHLMSFPRHEWSILAALERVGLLERGRLALRIVTQIEPDQVEQNKQHKHHYNVSLTHTVVWHSEWSLR